MRQINQRGVDRKVRTLAQCEGIIACFQSDREQGICWQPITKLPDPRFSSLWSFYQECAKVTPPNYWSLPGAPCGELSSAMTLPRLIEPMAYYREGIELYDRLPNPNPADDLVFTAMHTAIGFLAMEMSTEKIKFTLDEGYEIMCYGMEAITSQMPKPLALVVRWAAGVGSLGLAIERLTEAQAAIVLLAELLEKELARHLIEKAHTTLKADNLSSFQHKLLGRLPENDIKDMLLALSRLDSAY